MPLSFVTQEDALEESGWKLVHGDVFRPPRYHMLLSALIGTGVQLFGLTTLLIGGCFLLFLTMRISIFIFHVRVSWLPVPIYLCDVICNLYVFRFSD